MKWAADAIEGVVIAGGNGVGNRTDQFDTPGGIILDKNGTLYVVDELNHRILCIPSGAQSSSVIAGGHGQGNAPNQLSGPIYLALDEERNLYVSDWNNFRVQKFEKANPKPNSGIDVYNVSKKWILTFCYLSLMFSYFELFQ